MTDAGDPGEVDVAVVGGGVGGCYVAYRLASCGGPRQSAGGVSPPSPLLGGRGALTVALYERSGRIGGRLWSCRLPGLPEVSAELGGMRFHEQIHLVSDLVRHLGLTSQVGELSLGEPENFAYVRGVRCRRRQLSAAPLGGEPAGLPYRLRPAERGRDADGLAALAAEVALPGFSARRQAYHAAFGQRRWGAAAAAAAAYEERKDGSRVAATPLHAMSWQTLLGLALSPEGVALLEDAGGYNSLDSNGNAANWLDNLFYVPDGVRHRRLMGGFDVLPRTLCTRHGAAGGQVWLDHGLERFDRAPPAHRGPAYDLVFRHSASGRRRRVRARVVVLAMPQRSLALLDQDNFFFRDETLRLRLRSVQAVPAVKLFVAYPFAWWQETGVGKGRSTTDLPLRQVWYWGVGQPAASAGAGGGGVSGPPALLLAAYANGSAAAYWQELQAGEPFADAWPGEAAGPAAAPLASRRMVERAHALLLEVHGVRRAPLPYAARWQDWSADPFGGAWHVWREGCNARAIIPFMRRPLAGENVFIVGDCWSHEPGSVQGSLANAECLLQDHLGLGWPPWLRREGTRLGPRGRE